MVRGVSVMVMSGIGGMLVLGSSCCGGSRGGGGGGDRDRDDEYEM